MVTFVSTRVGFGSNAIGSPAPITPGSYSHLEPNITTQNIGTNRRYWSFTASQDGAVRVDAELSKPGPRTWGPGYIDISVLKLIDGTPTTQNLRLDNGATVSFARYPGNPGGGSVLVEAGETYIVQVWPRNNIDISTWGLVLRMSALAPASGEWLQPADRTVTTWDSTGAGVWQNSTAVETWDTILGARGTSGTGANYQALSGGGSFAWDRSFHGLDPIYELSGLLAIDVPWRHAINGGDQTLWAAPAFDGTLAGVPPNPDMVDPHWGGGGSVQVGQDWEYSSWGLGFFDYVKSAMRARATFGYFSLSWERWKVGPAVGYTNAELYAIAGVSTTEVTGIIFEEELPEILDVSVIADWDGVILGTAAPAQWWVGPTRFSTDLIEINDDGFNTYPIPSPPQWGPWSGMVLDVLLDPDRLRMGGMQILEGGAEAKPRDYINDTGMVQIGVYNAGDGTPVYEVPESIWQQALEIEEAMRVSSPYEEESAEDFPQFWQPWGLTFLAGTDEYLAESPVGPGLPIPVLDTTNSKGLNAVRVWPKINYRPSRFKVVPIPELEVPLLVPTAGPPSLRQHFEPIPPS